MYVVVGAKGKLLTSRDGIKWIDRRTPLYNTYIFSVTYDGNSQFAAVAHSGNIITSSNGIHWKKRNSGTIEHLYTVTYGNSKFVAAGHMGTILSSPDGTSWSFEPSPIDDEHFWGVAYGNGRFVVVGQDMILYTSSN
jgi:photosystem II stability/assembly factor-like uncharacterized protein